jgi:hypothetical protein
LAGTTAPATITIASPDYFAVLGLPLIAGRYADTADTGAPAIAISEGLARRFWPGQPALGQVLTSDAWVGPRTVTGVVRDAANAAIWREKEMAIYLTPDQTQDPRALTAVLVRTDGDVQNAQAAIPSVIATIDPTLRVTAAPLVDLLRLWLLPSQVAAAASATLAVLALVLASFGLYAVLSFAVSHRLREIGIRMALGATPRDVAGLVLRDAVRLVGVGIAAGSVGAAAAAPLLSRLLYGVSPFDPATMLGVAAIFGAVSVAAAYLPVRRATRLEPLAVLRVE